MQPIEEIADKMRALAELLGWTNIHLAGQRYRGHRCYMLSGIDPDDNQFRPLPQFFSDLQAAWELGEVMIELGLATEWAQEVERWLHAAGYPLHPMKEVNLLQAAAFVRAEAALVILRKHHK